MNQPTDLIVPTEEIRETVPATIPDAPDHGARAHHHRGMSKLNALKACAGYDSAGGTNTAAEAGTRLHEHLDLAIAAVIKRGRAPQWMPLTAALDELIAAGTITVEEEEEHYLRFCAREVDKFLPHATAILNEIRVYIRRPNGDVLNYGSLDLLLLLPNGVGLIFDYKFGWVPVESAATNMQGKGYTVGALQQIPALKKIASVFLQPKLDSVTTGIFERKNLHGLYKEIETIIDLADAPTKTLRPSSYCKYCLHAGTCTALIKSAAAAVNKFELIELPDVFDGLQITTPKQVILAYYLIDQLEAMIAKGGVRAKAMELAVAAGGSISEVVAGRVLTLEVKSRKSPRSANSPILIAETLQDVLTPEQVLGCCDLSIGKLEEIFADEYVARAQKEADKIISDAETAALAEPDKKLATNLRKEGKTRAREAKITRKDAAGILNDTLRVEGLVTSGEGVVSYLKLKVETAQPTLETHAQNQLNS